MEARAYSNRKNIIKKGEQYRFETSKDVLIRLLGNTEKLTKIEGKNLFLEKVKLEKAPEHYSFGEQVCEIG